MEHFLHIWLFYSKIDKISPMNSLQNLSLLQNLYRLKALGFSYSDPIIINKQTPKTTFKNINELNKSVQNCFLCDLSKSRQNPMIGQGNIKSKIMFIDYSVSVLEDTKGEYYSGKSGEMLKNMIEKVLNIKVQDVYITHAIKCKPLNQKEPTQSEWESCKNYLLAQIELIKPKIVVALGKGSYAKITGDDSDFEKARGHFIEYKEYKLMPMYHPNHLLRNPQDKKVALQDLQTIKSYL